MDLTAKELMHLEDYLNMEKGCENTMRFYAAQTQDQQAKDLLQQMQEKSRAGFQRMVKYVSPSQDEQ